MPEKYSADSRRILLGMVPVLTHAPPRIVAAFDQRDALAEVGCLSGAFFAGRT